MIFRKTLGAGIASMALASAAHANILINGSLETTKHAVLANGLIYVGPNFNEKAIPGWTITSGRVDIVPNTYWQASVGNDSIDMVGTASPGSIRQTFATTAGDTYGLTFDFSVNPEATSGEENTTKILQVQFVAADGRTVLSSDIFTDTVGDRTKTDMEWEQKALQFTATGAKATLVVTALTPGGLPHGLLAPRTRCGPVVDNFDLIDLGSGQPTPEPASLAVLGAGGLLLLKRRRPA